MQVIVAPSEQVVIVLFLVVVGSETKFVNRTVKRNPERFPKDFVFTLTDEEWQDLRFQIGTLKKITDRFLIIDDQELYHFGASLKDLGKKCFAFLRMDELLSAVRLHII